MDEEDACPKGGVHGWEFDVDLDIGVVLRCWKCGCEAVEKPTES